MTNLDEYLNDIISEIKENSDLHELAKKINNNISSYGYEKNEQMEEIIYNLLIDLQKGNIDIDNFINKIKDNLNEQSLETNSLLNNQSDTSYDNGNNDNSNVKKESTTTYKATDYRQGSTNIPNARSLNPGSMAKSTPIIDVNTELVNEVAQDYSEVEENVSNNKITITNDEIMKEAENLLSTAEEGNQDIQTDLNNVKTAMIESMSSIEYVDDQIEPVDFSDFDFGDIWNYSGKIIANGVRKVDAEFFENNGYQVNGNIVTIGGYTYNIKNNKLTVNGESTIVKIYVPNGVSDYSKVNTVTMFEDVGDRNITSNAILISLGEVDGLKINRVANATKFVNTVTKTDLTKCQNIITGGSRFGARSLQIAAETGDLYQTIVCVNNAILVKGINASGQGKTFFTDVNELKKLDGKNIYLISSKKDPNLYMYYKNGNDYAKCSDIKDGYVYTGLNLAIKNCPNSKIYFVSNNDDPAFSKINSPNYYYGRSLWNKIANSDEYEYHKTYHNIIYDMVSTTLTGYNRYNS